LVGHVVPWVGEVPSLAFAVSDPAHIQDPSGRGPVDGDRLPDLHRDFVLPDRVGFFQSSKFPVLHRVLGLVF
jgi:hypothetical protein